MSKMINQRFKSYGMRIFILIWFGQSVSMIGSSLTSFGLGIWVYQQTKSITQFALVSLSLALPIILISPFAGALVDRWSRRWVMILSDLGSGLSTLAIAILLTTNQLEIWHIYLATAISATCGTFQIPAYEAAITMLVPKQHFGRANGMVQMGIALGQLIAPVLGGVLLVFIHLQGIIFIDFITFLFAIIPLLLVRFADPQDLSDQKTGQKKLLQSAIEGWQYIASRSGLLSLLVFTAISNFIVGFAEVLFTPLVLSFASEIELGTVLSIGGMGMLIGSLVVSTWGGSQRYILNVFGFTILGGLSILAAGMKTSVALVAVAAFLFFFGLPISNSSSQVIFQKKVSPHIQGRVFAFTGAVTAAALPLAYVIAAPLAEKIFEPLMSVDGWLAGSIGKIIGVGSGRGIGLLFAVLGILTILFTIVAYQYPRLRFVDDELPDIVQEKDITLGSNV
jgi:MFS transporter, DHA3 family, macrolide efflux protein